MSINKDYTTKISYTDTKQTVSTFWDQIAQFFSNLFSPPLTVVYGIIISAPFLDTTSPWLWAAAFIFLFLIPPILYVIYLCKIGLVSDFHLSIRTQRLRPLLLIIMNTIFWLIVFYVMDSPKYLIVLAGSCLILVVLMFLITLFWKMSGHGAAAGGICVVSLSLLGELAIPFTVLIPIIAWSRVRLERHSISQTLVGFLLGVMVFGTTLFITDLI